MSSPTWVDEYQDHEVWQTLDRIVGICTDHAPGSADAQSQLDHIRLVARELSSFRSASPTLISHNALADLNSSATNVSESLDRWIQDNADTWISAAYSSLASLQDAGRQWPMGSKTTMQSAAATLREAIKASQENVEHLAKKIVETQTASEGALAEYLQKSRDEFEEVLTKVSDHDASLTQRFSELETEASRVESLIDTVETRANAALTSFQNQFQSAEEKRSKAHGDLVEEHEGDLDELVNVSKKLIGEYRREEEQAFLLVKARVDELKNDIEKTVGAVGTAATAQWYKIHADEQKGAADKWRWFAVGLYAFAFIVVAYSVFWSGTENDSWKSTILKSTATATLIAGAIYASTESGKHRKAEFESKHTELTLRALDPFIATIDKKPRQRIRTDAARQVFSIRPIDAEYIDEYEADEELDEREIESRVEP